MDFKKVLQDLEGWFGERGFPFAVIGGVALHAYGISRLTYDLDLITVRDAQESIIPFLEDLGYETLHRSQGFSNHQHVQKEQGRLDLLYVRGRTAEQLFREAVQRELFEEIWVPVPRPEHLIALKLHSMQNEPDRAVHDLADLRSLLALPEVDQAQAEEEFQKRGQQDIYEQLLQQFQR